MTAPSPAAPVSVRGGGEGVQARFDDMAALAGFFAHAAGDVGAVAVALQGHLANLSAVGGALVDPAGAARFEEELGLALDGPHGLVMLAASCGFLAAGIRAAASAYRAADELDTDVHMVVDPLVGLARAEWQGALTTYRTGSVVAGLNAAVTADPGLADCVGAVARLVVTGDRPLEAALADGHAEVRDLGMVEAPTGAAPSSIADIVQALGTRNEGTPGEVDVRFVYRADGTRAVIVDIPGTKSWAPWHTPDITSLPTNVRALQGEQTSYSRGVLEAMKRAGVRSDEPVMLVGHSEGGMVAVRAAIDADASKEFRVTHVVTAGSPIGQFAAKVPASVQVLAIENRHDLVPHLDAATNPPLPNVTTVTVDRNSHAVMANHDVDGSYLPGARDIDASSNPSVRDYIASADGFLDGSGVRAHRFVVARRY
jgi:pimeloyl-ACP methyl ester carboxylesterase